MTGSEVPLKVMASDNRDALIRLARDPLTIRRTRFDALRGLTDLMDAAQAAAPALHGRRAGLVWGEGHAGAAGRDRPRLEPHAGGRALRACYADGYHLLLRDQNRALPIGDVIGWMLPRATGCRLAPTWPRARGAAPTIDGWARDGLAREPEPG